MTHRPATRALPSIAVGAAAALLLSACAAGSTGAGAATPAPVIPLMPSANPFTSAVVFTNGLGTAKLAVNGTVEVGGTTLARSGSITAGMDPHGYGIATWTSDGSTVDEIVSDKAVFVRPAGSTGLWTQRPDGDKTVTSRMITPMTGLGELTDLRIEGTDPIDDAPTTRYVGRLAASPDRLRALGLTDDDLASVGDTWEGASIDVTAWVDGKNRIVRVDRAFDVVGQEGTPVRAATSTVLTDFATGLNLVAPKSGDVTSLSASAS